MSYNTMMVNAFVVAVLLLPKKKDVTHIRLRLIASGFFTAIAIQAYPSMIVTLILFGVFILLNSKEHKLGNLTFFCIGGFLVLTFFLVFLCINS